MCGSHGTRSHGGAVTWYGPVACSGTCGTFWRLVIQSPHDYDLIRSHGAPINPGVIPDVARGAVPARPLTPTPQAEDASAPYPASSPDRVSPETGNAGGRVWRKLQLPPLWDSHTSPSHCSAASARGSKVMSGGATVHIHPHKAPGEAHESRSSAL